MGNYIPIKRGQFTKHLELSEAGYYRRADGRGTFTPLGRLATIFQIEFMAILVCSYRIAKLATENKRISICSASQAAFRELDSRTVTSKLVWECKEALRVLAAKNKVQLIKKYRRRARTNYRAGKKPDQVHHH
ncbi:hypothetical protein TKK_0015663 [Trichogramma kaykai]